MGQDPHPSVFLVDGRRGILGNSRLGGPPGNVLIHLDDGTSIEGPTSALKRRADGSLLFDDDMKRSASGTDVGEMVVPIVVEEAVVAKARSVTGRVRVGKTIRERRQVVDEPVFRETVEIVRVPADRVVEAIPEIRQDGETTIIPVVEEELIVIKRLRLREEIHIIRRRVEERRPREVVLRAEEVSVERSPEDETAQRLPTR